MYLVGKVNQVSLMRGIKATRVGGFKNWGKLCFCPLPQFNFGKISEKVKS